ncbi:hypothetical protein [Streptomyces sp. NBC_01190]|uniref:hypothetical protein n=1 Tax=Streptomyces sp. NBC_01190 TaxID=2903767 RepID=UPI003869E76D|nr:hypothetical protein OG519_32190 [Streptomyces sp. NBC_01190]
MRTVAQQPASLRADITTFQQASPLTVAQGAVTATVCASKYGRTLPEPLPYCTNPGSTSPTSRSRTGPPPTTRRTCRSTRRPI